MDRKITILTLFLGAAGALTAAQSPQPQNPLHRQYREGETLAYRMDGVNESRHYSIQADGLIKKDATGSFFEQFRWSNMVWDGQPAALSHQTDAFRQRLTLDPDSPPSAPDLTKVDPSLRRRVADAMRRA